MRSVSINHMRETSHEAKSFYKGIYSDIGYSGVETMELWDECQDCDFKTNVEIRQRRTSPVVQEMKGGNYEKNNCYFQQWLDKRVWC